ncbi:TetR family transcriptional regulator [Scopulibacillus darangshiensis]|uniref:TetR family transcriptional regulator n=1 Tax=Scopulibacillus darangshiensis TaxID=442528 RepID=A0A4R2P9K5_9BACL|nr:TetR/AcrR family transcriptional regulator [Scopulibacillus darangshiensis]TCP30904.1 TetR family transcriptional regulator [Scopulibacillus darangshiensis]
MAKRKIDFQDLMAETERLLLEKGYDGFHFKLLANRLNVARSTIYEYYASKEELVTAYMINIMNRLTAESEALKPLASPLMHLKELMQIFIKYSQIHQITQMIPLINRDSSPAVKSSIDRLSEEHTRLYQTITDLIEKAKQTDEIRSDIPSSVLARVYFTAIEIPNDDAMNHRDWSELIFQVLYEGMSGTKRS